MNRRTLFGLPIAGMLGVDAVATPSREKLAALRAELSNLQAEEMAVRSDELLSTFRLRSELLALDIALTSIGG